MPPRKKAASAGSAADGFHASPADMPAEDVQKVLQRLQSGQLTHDLILWLCGLHAPGCGGSCKSNTKSCPTCFCGLAPAPGTWKKKGLWRKEPELLTRLGPDPSSNERQLKQPPSTTQGTRDRPHLDGHQVISLACKGALGEARQRLLSELSRGCAHEALSASYVHRGVKQAAWRPLLSHSRGSWCQRACSTWVRHARSCRACVHE
jgi:hypothetical protein